MHMKNKEEEYCQGMTQNAAWSLLWSCMLPFSDWGDNWQFDEEDRKGRAGATWKNEDVAESSQWGAGLGMEDVDVWRILKRLETHKKICVKIQNFFEYDS